MDNNKQLEQIDELQLRILAALYYLGELYYSEIIDFLPRSKAMANRRLQNLEKLGLVKKRVDPDSRPIKVYYSITEAGKKFLDESIQQRISEGKIKFRRLLDVLFMLPSKIGEISKIWLLDIREAELRGLVEIKNGEVAPTRKALSFGIDELLVTTTDYLNRIYEVLKILNLDAVAQKTKFKPKLKEETKQRLLDLKKTIEKFEKFL